MRSLMRGLALSLVLATSLASAEEVDFLARMNNLNLQSPGAQRLVSSAIFSNPTFNNEGGVKLVSFTIALQDGDTETIVFEGGSSISPAQTSVITGNNNTGRIELTYDAVNSRLEARFSFNALVFRRYRIYASSGSWFGQAEINSGIAL
jgi:hypothetical protein